MTEEASIKRGDPVSTPHPESPGAPQSSARRIIALLARGPAGLRSPATRWAVNGLALTGGALIVVSAIIHLHLWAQGYRGITVIGPLFLAQGVVSIPIAIILGLFRRLGLLVAGAALMAGTAVGLVLSAQIGLFGFKDTLAAPYAGMSLVVEVAGTGLLLAGAILIAAARPSPARRGTRRRRSG
jgi:hypothetical protein